MYVLAKVKLDPHAKSQIQGSYVVHEWEHRETDKHHQTIISFAFYNNAHSYRGSENSESYAGHSDRQCQISTGPG